MNKLEENLKQILIPSCIQEIRTTEVESGSSTYLKVSSSVRSILESYLHSKYDRVIDVTCVDDVSKGFCSYIIRD